MSFCDLFYSRRASGKYEGTIAGFPKIRGSWCKKLKYEKVDLLRYLLSEDRAASRERERVAARQLLERRFPNLRLPDHQRNLVSVIPQTISFTGFPNQRCRWCTGELKKSASITVSRFLPQMAGTGVPLSKGSEKPLTKPENDGRKINIVHYIGIAADEPLRIKKHIGKRDMILPLVQIGWDEALCGLEAQYMGMLSPTYSNGKLRDGCWFCHNQSVSSLRDLRHDYPDLWAELMKLDLDSPVTFHADGHTVHDFDRRFQLEDEGLIDPLANFRWTMLDEELQFNLF